MEKQLQINNRDINVPLTPKKSSLVPTLIILLLITTSTAAYFLYQTTTLHDQLTTSSSPAPSPSPVVTSTQQSTLNQMQPLMLPIDWTSNSFFTSGYSLKYPKDWTFDSTNIANPLLTGPQGCSRIYFKDTYAKDDVLTFARKYLNISDNLEWANFEKNIQDQLNTSVPNAESANLGPLGVGENANYLIKFPNQTIIHLLVREVVPEGMSPDDWVNQPCHKLVDEQTKLIPQIVSSFTFSQPHTQTPTISWPPSDYPIKIGPPDNYMGTIPSGWMFEGQLFIEITDNQGNVLTSGTARQEIGEDWTSGNPTRFSITLSVSGDHANGFLVIHKANPSGLPENDEAFKYPITFESQ